MIGEWIDKANDIFAKYGINLKGKIKKTKRNLTFDQLFGLDNMQIAEKEYRLGTIHSIKGETFDAILVILKDKIFRNRIYKTLLEINVNLIENE